MNNNGSSSSSSNSNKNSALPNQSGSGSEYNYNTSNITDSDEDGDDMFIDLILPAFKLPGALSREEMIDRILPLLGIDRQHLEFYSLSQYDHNNSSINNNNNNTSTIVRNRVICLLKSRCK